MILNSRSKEVGGESKIIDAANLARSPSSSGCNTPVSDLTGGTAIILRRAVYIPRRDRDCPEYFKLYLFSFAAIHPGSSRRVTAGRGSYAGCDFVSSLVMYPLSLSVVLTNKLVFAVARSRVANAILAFHAIGSIINR